MKTRFTLFICFILSQITAQQSITTIDVNSPLMSNSKYLFGITMDSRTGMSGTNGPIGYFNPDGTLIPEVDPLFNDFPVNSLRYPGNGIMNGFDWKKSVGLPAISRPSQNILGSSGPAQAVQFGFDEFMTWTNSKGVLNSNVQIMLPIYDLNDSWLNQVQQKQAFTNVAQHCADWVEYANAPNDSSNPGGGIDWAAERALNGHPAPYGIEIWNMGNEPWGGNEFTSSVAGCNSYLTMIEPIIDAMRLIDPTIKITLATVGTNTSQNTWHYTILNSSLVASGKIYGLSPHAFPVETSANSRMSVHIAANSNLAAACQAKGLKVILGDYAQGIPQTPATQADQDLAMQWDGTIHSVDFLLGMSQIDNLERVNFWVFGMPSAVWHPIRNINGNYTLMPLAQMYKKLVPLVLDHSVVCTNTSPQGSDGNPYGVNTSSFVSNDLSLLNVIAVNRDLQDTHTFKVNGNSNYDLQNARLLSALLPTDEVIIEISASIDANGDFIIPPMSILILENTIKSNSTSEISISKKTVTIYPNPSNSQLNFSEYLDNYIITNSLGQKIATGSGKFVSTSEMENGIYFLSTEKLNLRFIVQH